MLAVSALFLWPGLYNGQPIFFSDTTSYVRGADAGVQKLTGISTSWSQPQGSVPKAGDTSAKQSSTGSAKHRHRSVSSVEEKSVLAGRSIYYGALLYLGHLTGGFWLSIGLQALLLATALALTLKASGLPSWPHLALVAAVTCLTSAPFFASFLMPDLFSGLTILSCAMLIVAATGQSRSERFFWFALLTASLLFHTTHNLLAAVMLGLGSVIRVLEKTRAQTQGLILIGAALVLSYMGGAAFNFAVTRLVGEPPIRPPFLMARTIDDGPGFRYLQATCPQNGFVVCRFLDRLPLDENDFLWDTEKGVFAAADPQTRRALSREQFRFAVAAVTYDPIGQLKASINNVFILMTSVELEAFQYYEGYREAWATKLPSEYWATMQRTAAYSNRMPTEFFTIVVAWSALLAFFYLAYVFIRYPSQLRQDGLPSIRISALVVVGALANTVICGVLSGPRDRYQLRVIWLLPVLALIVDLARRQEWWNRILSRLSPATLAAKQPATRPAQIDS